MKKSLVIAAALAFGTAALAQDMSGTAPAGQAMQPGTTQAPADQGTMPADGAATATPDATAGQPGMTPPAGDGSMGTTGAQGMGTGTAGMSGSTGMSGGAMGGNMADAQAKAAQTDTSNLPKCSATVKDSCVQSGATGRRTMHRTTRHHMAKKSS